MTSIKAQKVLPDLTLLFTGKDLLSWRRPGFIQALGALAVFLIFTVAGGRAQAQATFTTATTNVAGSYPWTTLGTWNSTNAFNYPGAGATNDIADVLSNSTNEILIYNGTTDWIGTLNISEATSGVTNDVQLGANMTINSALVLGGTNVSAGTALLDVEGYTLADSAGITVSTNGVLDLGNGTGTSDAPTITANITLNGGTISTATNFIDTGTVTETINGTLTMSSGALDIAGGSTSTNGAGYRFTMKGNNSTFSATGGTINFAYAGTGNGNQNNDAALYLQATSNTIGSNVTIESTVTTNTYTAAPPEIVLTPGATGTNTTENLTYATAYTGTTNVDIFNLVLRNTNATPYILTSTVTYDGTGTGYIGQVNVGGTGSVMLNLGSNLTVATGFGNLANTLNAPGGTGTGTNAETATVNLDGYTFNASNATTPFEPASNGTNDTDNWVIESVTPGTTNTVAGGTLINASYNFSNSTDRISIGNGVVLEATGTTQDYFLNHDTNSYLNVNAGSTFWYVGSAASIQTSNAFTTTETYGSTLLGNLTVGNGTSTSTLTSDGSLAAAGTITVTNNGTLTMGTGGYLTALGQVVISSGGALNLLAGTTSNTFAGAVTINGKLTSGTSSTITSSVASPAFTINSGGILVVGGTISDTSNSTGFITLNGGGALLDGSGNEANLQTLISSALNTGALSNTSNYFVGLSASETFSTNLNLSGLNSDAVFEIANSQNVSTSSNAMIILPTGDTNYRLAGPGGSGSINGIMIGGTAANTNSLEIVTGGINIVTGNSSFTGGVTIDPGASLTMTNTTRISSSNTYTVNGTMNLFDTDKGYLWQLAVLNGTNTGVVTNTSASGFNKTAQVTNGGTFNGTITDGFNGGTTTNEATIQLQVSGGTLTLTGSNSYSGGTVISGGTLAISNDNQLGAAYTGALSGVMLTNVGSGYTSSNTPPSVTFSSGGAAATASLVGTTNATTTVNYITLNTGGAGSGYIADPTVTTSGDNGSGAAGFGEVQGLVTLSGGTLETTSNVTSSRAISITTNSTINTDGFTSTFSGIVNGAGGLTEMGGGTLILGTSNTYTGGTTINAASVLQTSNVAAAGSMQSLGEGTNVTLAGTNSGTNEATLDYTGGTATFGQNITVSTGGFGDIENRGVSGTVLDLSGNISKNGSVLTLSGGEFVVSGVISGSSNNSDLDLGSTTYGGAATVALTTTNTYNGPTSINDGSYLLTTTNNALPTAPASNVTLGTNTDSGVTNTLDLGGNSETVATLNVASTSNNVINQVISSASTGSGTNLTTTNTASSAQGTLTVTTSTNDTFSGSLGGSGSATNFGLVMNGTGTLTLSGSNTYTGPTTVTTGTLLISGSTVSPTNTINGGTLQGNGFVKGIIVNSGGNVTPGAAGFTPQELLSSTTNNVLTATSLTLNGGSSLTYNLYSSAVSPPLAAPLGGNAINLSGGMLTFTGLGTGTNALTLDFNGTGTVGFGTLTNGTPAIYDLITDFSTSNLSLATLNSDLANGDIVLNNLTSYGMTGTNAIPYADFVIIGSTGDYTLQLDVVPEPGTWAMFALGLALLIVYQRRKSS